MSHKYRKYCPRCGDIHEPGDPLTPRMLEVLRAYAETDTYQAAALKLNLNESTVRTHAGRAYCRLGVNSPLAAFRTLGWLQIPDAA